MNGFETKILDKTKPLNNVYNKLREWARPSTTVAKERKEKNREV